MHAIDQIGILTGIERAVRRQQERLQITMNVERGLEICRILELLIRKRIDTQILGLHLHDLFEMRMLPIAVSRILIDAAPRRIDQIELRIQRLSRHLFGLRVTFARQRDGELSSVPIEIFLIGAPASVFRIVAGDIVFLQPFAKFGRKERAIGEFDFRLRRRRTDPA